MMRTTTSGRQVVLALVLMALYVPSAIGANHINRGGRNSAKVTGKVSSEAFLTSQDCLTTLSRSDGSKSLKKVRKEALGAIKTREAQLVKLRKQSNAVKDTGHRELLLWGIGDNQHQAATTMAAKIAAAKASIKSAPNTTAVHKVRCQMLFDTRLFSFWPGKISFIVAADRNAAEQASLRKKLPSSPSSTASNQLSEQLNGLIIRNNAFISTLVPLSPMSISSGTEAKTFLSAYKLEASSIHAADLSLASRIAASNKRAKARSKRIAPTIASTPALSHTGDASPLNLKLPPNFQASNKDKYGYFLLPPSPRNKDYFIHTAKIPGRGVHSSSSARSHRRANQTMIMVFYSVAVEYHKKFPKSKLVAGDLNAPGHPSHRFGNEMDIYTSDASAATRSNRGGNNRHSAELAKMLIDTGKVDVILFNEPSVAQVVNSYAKNGRMVTGDNLDDYHFHVKVTDAPGGCAFGNIAQCENARSALKD